MFLVIYNILGLQIFIFLRTIIFKIRGFNMKMIKKLTLKVLVVPILSLFLLTTSAFALYIDFTDSSYSSSYNQTSYQSNNTIPDLTLTFEALTAGSTLWWDEIDGFGIQGSAGYEGDEIDSSEILRLGFSEGVNIDEIHVTDLFYEWGTTELGLYSLNGGAPDMFGATQIMEPGNNGDLIIYLAGTNVNYIDFFAPQFLGHEYSVAGINVEPIPTPEPGTLLILGTGINVEPIPIPEPGTLLLLGSGLLGFIFFRKKIRKN